ncbi:MAG: DUF6273 domain-containing protein [Bacilli bacterium]|nr:DUF6273 domain-containing protein [Bacilli bacterium]
MIQFLAKHIVTNDSSDSVLTDNSVEDGYKEYWKASIDGSYTFSNLVMNDNYTVVINANKKFTIMTEVDGVVITPSTAIQGNDYEGEISLNSENADPVLPLKLDSVTLLDENEGADITDECTYEVHDDNQDAYFKIPKELITSNIKVSLSLKSDPRWCDFANWWDYCSNGVDGQQAVESDINGNEVYVKVNGLMHGVRLIGVDIDKDASGNTIHSTFDFANLITGSDGNAIQTAWDNSDGDQTKNFDYRKSTLNAFLNGTPDGDIQGTVLEMLPEGLRNKIKPANKLVGVSIDSGTTYTATAFDPSNNMPYPKLFPLAHDEIDYLHKYQECVVSGEDSGNGLYKLFNNFSDFLEYAEKTAVGSDKAYSYWLRSPSTDNSKYHLLKSAFFVTNAPMVSYSAKIYDTENKSIAPAFCI